MKSLDKSDYITILKHYNVPIPTKPTGKPNGRVVKLLAENILANKLCRCIKKLNPRKNEKKQIAICRKSIFLNRNMHIGHFKCEDGAKLVPKKGTRIAVHKRKTIKFNKTRKQVQNYNAAER